MTAGFKQTIFYPLIRNLFIVDQQMVGIGIAYLCLLRRRDSKVNTYVANTRDIAQHFESTAPYHVRVFELKYRRVSTIVWLAEVAF